MQDLMGILQDWLGKISLVESLNKNDLKPPLNAGFNGHSPGLARKNFFGGVFSLVI